MKTPALSFPISLVLGIAAAACAACWARGLGAKRGAGGSLPGDRTTYPIRPLRERQAGALAAARAQLNDTAKLSVGGLVSELNGVYVRDPEPDDGQWPRFVGDGGRRITRSVRRNRWVIASNGTKGRSASVEEDRNGVDGLLPAGENVWTVFWRGERWRTYVGTVSLIADEPMPLAPRVRSRQLKVHEESGDEVRARKSAPFQFVPATRNIGFVLLAVAVLAAALGYAACVAARRRSEMAERVTAMLECGICLERFDPPLRTPRILSCGHTYCEGCLQSLLTPLVGVVGHKELPCPTCRKLTKVPQGQASQLGKNYTAIALLEE